MIRARGLPSLHVPDHAVDAQSLVALADLVVSAGGTINREAVALGVPVYTTFAGRIGAVDEALLRAGRLRRLQDPQALQLVGRGPAGERTRRDPVIPIGLIDSLLDAHCLGDPGALHAHGLVGAHRQEQPVTLTDQLLGARLVQDHPAVGQRRGGEGQPRRHVGLDQTGDHVDRRTLGGQHQVDAGGPRELGDPDDGVLHVWDLESLREIRTHRPGLGRIRTLRGLDNDRWFVGAVHGERLSCFRMRASGAIEAPLSYPASIDPRIALDPTGQRAFVSSELQSPACWDLGQGMIRSVSLHERADRAVTHVAQAKQFQPLGGISK